MAARSKARKRALDLLYASELRGESALDALGRAVEEGEGPTNPYTDRNVLRLGVYELLYVDEVPDAVAVSEAMALVRDLSTDESPQFVNGVLGAVLRNKASLV